MKIQHKEEDGIGMFYIEDNGNTLAELVYSIRSPDQLIIEHTEVDHSLSGKGVGRQLVEAIVDYSRSNKIKIIPVCSFAKSVFEQEPEWKDVL